MVLAPTELYMYVSECVCLYDLQLHVVSQSLHCVQVNSGLTNQKQPPLLPHLTFNPKGIWQNSLRTHTQLKTWDGHQYHCRNTHGLVLYPEAWWVVGRTDGVTRQFGSISVRTLVEDQLTWAVLANKQRTSKWKVNYSVLYLDSFGQHHCVFYFLSITIMYLFILCMFFLIIFSFSSYFLAVYFRDF